MFEFNVPSTFSISGTTKSGKTTWVFKLLKYSDQMFSIKPEKILYCYGIWQNLFTEMEKEIINISFHEGLPSCNQIEALSSNNNHNIIVLDDLMMDCVKNKEIELLFTRGAHHKNISVIFLNQNMFCQGKHARTIALNCHYLILFQNLRDSSQISKLGQQIFPGQNQLLINAYKDCMQRKYGYIVIDLTPDSEQIYRLRTLIFPEEDTIIYPPHGSM